MNWGQAVQEEFFLECLTMKMEALHGVKSINWMLHDFKNVRAMEQ